jgi:hypothetical protein
MKLNGFPFEVTDWKEIKEERHDGETGFATWKTRKFGEIRVRMVEYSAGYQADHWCEKGHIILLLEGELYTEIKDGKVNLLQPGMSYQVSDNLAPHRSHTDTGAKLFIVD